MPNHHSNKKHIFFFLFLIIFLGIFVISFSVQGGGLSVQYPKIGGSTINASTTFPQYISYIAKLLLWVSLAVIFAIFAIASVRYMTSAGNPPTMRDAKNQIMAALLGLVIIFSSYLILYTVNPELVKLKFSSLHTPLIPTTTVSSTSLASLHSYNVIPVGQLIKEGIYGRHAMITASSTLNTIDKIITRPPGIDLGAILAAAKGQVKNFDTDACISQCYNVIYASAGCWMCGNPDIQPQPQWCQETGFCYTACTNYCESKKTDFSSLTGPNFRSLELIEAIDSMIADTAANCKCESPNPDCCQCHGSLCSACCSSSDTGYCGPTSSSMTTKCHDQPVGCPGAHCDTTTIKILSKLLGAAEGGTSPFVTELDNLRVHGAIDPRFPHPPLHITKRFENGPANIMTGLLQAQDIISNYNANNYNSIIGLIETYGPQNVSTTPLDDWMKTFWVKNKSDPLSFYIDAGTYNPTYTPPYNPVNPPIVTGNCSQYNGKQSNDKGIKMTLFCQCPDPWGEMPIGSQSCQNQTMCKYGCLITSLDMLFKHYGIAGMNNPGTALQTFKDNNCIVKDDSCGFTNGNIKWNALNAYLKSQGYTLIAPIVSSLPDLKTTYFDNNIPVLASCTNFNGHSLHYIILRGYENSTVYIADPGWGNTYLSENDYHAFMCSPIDILEKLP